LAQNKQQAAQQQAQQQAQDPIIQMQMQELQLKAQEQKRKNQKDITDAQIKMEQLKIEAQRVQTQKFNNAGQLAANAIANTQKLKSAQKTAGGQMAMDIIKTRMQHEHEKAVQAAQPAPAKKETK
jgi:hypothetical protein